VFGTTLVAFFLLEMGDKTQIATVALAAKYSSLASVVAGTTLGMMIANVPAVLLGEVAAKKLPMRLVHGVVAVTFLALGVSVLLGSARSAEPRASGRLEVRVAVQLAVVEAAQRLPSASDMRPSRTARSQSRTSCGPRRSTS